ncbi:MAG: prolipoprotein diacylglyceryl transferase [Bacteroidetes bacterium]|jgi:phosphatidylglycerol:prolipoprotein diacylglycerol transferase|nr:prolipoprotein diacylglyceryl transferase [Bacteroidota bacterium]
MLSLFINWNPSPDIFTIPGIDWPVRWYGLSWAMAFIGCHFFMNRIYKAEGRTEAQLDVLTLYIVVATVLGARLGHCLFYGWEYYSQHPLEILKVWEGGLASHGGGIGILIGMWLYCRKTKESWLWLFDRLIVVVPFASFMIRFGNLMNSEIIGEPTNVPWAFVFHQVDELPRHPTQLYEAIFYFFLFILFYWLWKNKRNDFGKGFMFGLFCVLMFGFRFGMEFMKENQEAFEASLPINMGQILSIPFILVGLYMMYRSKQESKHINPSEAVAPQNS